DLLGVAPVAGRAIAPGDDVSGNSNTVALIGEGLWRRRFGSDPAILGKHLQMNGRLFNVIGIMPAGVRGGPDGAPGVGALRRLRFGFRPGAAGFTRISRSRKAKEGCPGPTGASGTRRHLKTTRAGVPGDQREARGRSRLAYG